MPAINKTHPAEILAAIRDRLTDGAVPVAVLVNADGDEPASPPADLFATVAMDQCGQPDELLESSGGDEDDDAFAHDPYLAEAEVLVSVYLRDEADIDGTAETQHPLILEIMRIIAYKIHNYEPPDPDDLAAVIVLQPLTFKGWRSAGAGKRNAAWRRWIVRIPVEFEWDYKSD